MGTNLRNFCFSLHELAMDTESGERDNKMNSTYIRQD